MDSASDASATSPPPSSSPLLLLLFFFSLLAAHKAVILVIHGSNRETVSYAVSLSLILLFRSPLLCRLESGALIPLPSPSLPARQGPAIVCLGPRDRRTRHGQEGRTRGGERRMEGNGRMEERKKKEKISPPGSRT